MPPTPAGLDSIEALIELLEDAGYIATRPIATALYLAHHLRKPVLIEGPAGVGKTELAVSAARASVSRCCGCSATKAWTTARHCTNGSTASSCCTRSC